jgi:small subunit ribosomal protein S9
VIDEEREDQEAGQEPEQPEGAEPETGAEDAPAAEDAAAVEDAPAAEEAPAEEAAEAEAERPERRERPKRKGKGDGEGGEEVIPGAHLEPDLVLEEQLAQQEGAIGELAEAEVVAAEEALADEEVGEEPEERAVAREPLDLAVDARYAATGKRKSAVARVILKPGGGSYTVNGRHLDEFFPRIKLQRMARQPLETAGYHGRLDVVARIHGGGISSQAGALRHGIARALVEADPTLRVELKRRGLLTRDPRVKERKKAGLKKARKRPQFSKR